MFIKGFQQKTLKSFAMFRFILLSFFYFIFFQVTAQNSYLELEEILNSKGDTVNDRLDYVLRNEFSQLINTNSNGMIGSFIGLSTDDNPISLAYNFARDKSSLEFNISGGANDGIAGIFSENKLKTGIQFGVKYHRLIGEQKIRLVHDDVKAIQWELADLDNINTLADLNYSAVNEKLIKDANQKMLTVDSLENIRDNLLLDKKNRTSTFDQTDLDKVLEQLKFAKLNEKGAMEKCDYNVDDWASGLRYNEYQEKRKIVLDKFRALRAKSFKLTWFSFGAGFSNETYNMFNPSLALDKQVFNENDFIPAANISFSHYTNNENTNVKTRKVKKVKYYTIGASIKYGNNLGSLSEVEIETKDSIASNRSVIKTQKAFSGTLEKNVVTAQAYFDYYQLGFTKNNLGFHLRGTVDFDTDFPKLSVRGGIIFSAMNKDDTKSIINFEIFYGLNNILKGDEENPLKRNILGIQTTFPFNPK